MPYSLEDSIFSFQAHFWIKMVVKTSELSLSSSAYSTLLPESTSTFSISMLSQQFVIAGLAGLALVHGSPDGPAHLRHDSRSKIRPYEDHVILAKRGFLSSNAELEPAKLTESCTEYVNRRAPDLHELCTSLRFRLRPIIISLYSCLQAMWVDSRILDTVR